MKNIMTIIAASFSLTGMISCSSLNESKPEEQTAINSIRGKVIDASMNTITILTPDNGNYFFSTVDAEKKFKKGLKLGNCVVITYSGELKGGDTRQVRVIRVSDCTR